MLTAFATLTKPFLLAMHGMNLWRKRRLNMAFEEAQAALDERMFVAGIDDGEHGAKISAVASSCAEPRLSEVPLRR